MKKLNNKGFTIVELVIVVAVIAILAAVLIPTISGLVKTAQTSADVTLVKNVNLILATERALEGKNTTMQEALDDALEGGYDVTKLTPTNSDNHILWDQESDNFVLFANGKYNNAGAEVKVNEADPSHLWRIADKTEGSIYSVYYTGDATEVTVNGVGFDAGTSSVANVKYENTTGVAKNVIIRTNGGKLTVEAKAGASEADSDTVKHYDYVEELVGVQLGQFSYHEFGTVKEATVSAGRFVAENTSRVFYIDVTAAGASLNVQPQANVPASAINGTYTEGTSTDEKTGTATEPVSECAAHTWENDYAVGDSYYHMCSVCGKVEKHAYDQWDGSIPETKPESLVYDVKNNKIYVNDVRAFAYVNKLDENGESVVKKEIENDLERGWYDEYIEIVLNVDIDFMNNTWTPMELIFNINGNNKTIKNIVINGSYEYAGLFTLKKDNGDTGVGYIKDLTVDGISVTNTQSNDSCTGTISGYANYSITNCKVVNATVNGGKYTGGIVGHIYGNIENCVVENSTIDGTYKVGGLVGQCNSEQGSSITVSNNVIRNTTVTCNEVLSGKTPCIGKFVGYSNVSGESITIEKNTFEGENAPAKDVGNK